MVTCDEVQSYLQGFPWTHNTQLDENVHGLRIQNLMSTPTSPLMPPKVEGLDMLSWHVGSVVEDESNVS